MSSQAESFGHSANTPSVTSLAHHRARRTRQNAFNEIQPPGTFAERSADTLRFLGRMTRNAARISLRYLQEKLDPEPASIPVPEPETPRIAPVVQLFAVQEVTEDSAEPIVVEAAFTPSPPPTPRFAPWTEEQRQRFFEGLAGI